MQLFRKSSPEEQKQSLRSLNCEVTCTAEHVQPEAGASLPD
eukprot:CAMPEP_0176101892 /NCGR_PEP_ID=MMETSP0120_2-20121206/51107_1 /TAXON_ID=160619 /ORGANISM="Kryptoperidinium foliaceum, Strain CCMP 1326" /LENGTH=40 /DNA_ID= /DNA_START= /DNA_END= /DNA_ORIENTATION=